MVEGKQFEHLFISGSKTVDMKISFILAVIILCSTNAVFGEDPLIASLYYESYCPYSIKFVRDQLVNVYKLFADHLHLDLVPYGNAEQRFVDGQWEFECQHGPQECLGNKLHACAINEACGALGTVSCASSKVSQVLEYISCVMNHRDQLQATAQCAKKSKLDADSIISCAKGYQGDMLLNFYGNLTEKYASWKKGVPTVTVNGENDEAAREDLMDRLCQLKPSVCQHARTEPEVLVV